MYKNKKIGIVILNYKDFHTVIKLINLIKSYNVIDKIVIVDNLSPDESFVKLKNIKNNKVDVIQSKKNGGYSYGNNFGAFYLIENYGVDILFIANPDVNFTEEFLKVSTDSLIKENIEVVSGIMLDKNGNNTNFVGKINTYSEDLLDCTVFLKKILKLFRQNRTAKLSDLIYCEMLPGSLFAIKATVYKEIGGFDENVFLYCEERILGEKLKKLNYKLAINRNISYYHLHSASINKSLAKIKQVKQLYQSRLYFNLKYRKIGFIKILIMKVCMCYGIYIRKILYKILY